MEAEMKQKNKSTLDQLVDELVRSGQTADEMMSEGGVLKELFKRVAERALGAEMAHHLGYEKHDPSGRGRGKEDSQCAEINR